MATFAHAYAMKERIVASLLRHPKIHGVGVGYHDPGNPKKGAAVVIYAETLTASSQGIAAALPVSTTQHSKVPIRVVKAKKIHAHEDFTRRIRPVPAGYSIGTTKGSGTAGLIVTNAPTGSQRYVLSNNHVLTNPLNFAARVETLQPGGADNGLPVKDRVGFLSQYAVLKKNAINLIDAALSIPVRNNILSPRYATVGVIPGHVTSYRVGERFKKVGRTTGLRYGTVDSVHTDVQVDYGEGLGVLTFRNQTVIRGSKPVSLPGDSGSVWLRRADNYAAAVNFAGTDDGLISVAFPIEWAMRRFKVHVARPGVAGRVRVVQSRSRAYAHRLTDKELASIQVIRLRRRARC